MKNRVLYPRKFVDQTCLIDIKVSIIPQTLKILYTNRIKLSHNSFAISYSTTNIQDNFHLRYPCDQIMHYFDFFITRAGFPTATLSAGMSLVTTLPAPIMQRSPIVTPGQMTAPPPIQQSSPIVTG